LPGRLLDAMKLLEIARKSIQFALDGKVFEPDESTKKKFSEKRACFVTLMLNGNLRGCIGSLTPRQELWKDVIENSINAAFNDPRFYKLTKEEFEKIKIEISILSEPREIGYSDLEDLKNKIRGRGVILSYGSHTATYLPQVWEQIKKPEDFLSSLCLKAGLSKDFWKNHNVKIRIYDVEKIKE